MRQAPEAPVSLSDFALSFQIEDEANRRRATEAASTYLRRPVDIFTRRDSQRRGALATLADPEWNGPRRTSKSRKGAAGMVAA